MNVECIHCAQVHPSGPHIYDFIDEVDDDLCCPICLSPFLNPTDLPCSHSFCRACVFPYLRKTPNCPQDRKPASGNSNIIILSVNLECIQAIF